MKKIIIFSFVLLIISSIAAKEARAFVNDDAGIQRAHLNKIPPHFNSTGQIQSVYNNNSFFPLILYFVDFSTLQEVKDAGFNTVFPAHQNFLDEQRAAQLEQFGLKGLPNLEGIGKGTPESNRLPLTAHYVNQLKNYSSILAWHLFDETATIGDNNEEQSLAIWRQMYDTIHQNDPLNRVVFANRGGGGFEPTIPDICNGDAYPIDAENTPLYTLGFSIDRMVAANCPALLILQAFTGDGWRFMPTPAQIRGQMYSTIVHGAVGLWLFVQENQYHNLSGISKNYNPTQWEAASIANHEITTYKNVFLSKTSPDEYHVAVDHRHYWSTHPVFDVTDFHSPIHTMLKDPGEGDTRYLLAVNMSGEANQGKFTFTKNYASVKSLFDNRNIVITNNTFTDAFEAYAVKLYKLETQAALPTDPLPIGSYDADHWTAGCTVSGWTCDPSNYGASVPVNVYVDGTTPANLVVVSTTASTVHNPTDPGSNNQCNGTAHDFFISNNDVRQALINAGLDPNVQHRYRPLAINIDSSGNARAQDANGNWLTTWLNKYISDTATCVAPSVVNISNLRSLLQNFTSIFDYNVLVGNYGKL